ncbi:carboxymuconolactone decarboxylase family protein [Pseudomonas sp. BN414]|uniref:carboxymuconolactone decarboxylase family protein n=1 Tax=Pseudomonas sp. BN414 TaxID=2567888 RepID=UPI002454ED27|nr:carboxymuconolactone decarboxylase family protein [Pseudomonas sp. BN414]MDH4568107.1 carboxymuconolactone decarboxylase family protein [Pseudomonas sp. BN414]
MSPASPLNYQQVIPDVINAMGEVHAPLDALGLERSLHHLVQLRASQLNQCAFCVKMHTREAREDGETSERLDRLVVWDHCNDFTPREKAALAWTEALTQLDRRTDYAALRTNLREHFSEVEIGALTATVAMINLWNRIQISRH